MRVYLGSDHAGFELKAHLVGWLREHGHQPSDVGPFELVADDDYPAYCIDAATRAVNDAGSLGVVIGGSGNGEAIAANKVPGVRCAVAFSDETARLARLHNDANVLSLGARMYDEVTATRFLELFVTTGFSGEERHVRRIAEVRCYEAARARAEPAGPA